MKKYLLAFILGLTLSAITAHAVTTLQVPQGGTGASTLTGCLTGNGTAAITGSGVACGTASITGGTAGMLTSWVNGSTLTATSGPTFGWFIATSTTATSTFAGGLTGPGNFIVQQNSGRVGIGTTDPGAPLEISNPIGGFGQGNYLTVSGSIVDNVNVPCVQLKGGTLVTAYPAWCLSNGGLASQFYGGAAAGIPEKMELSLNSSSAGGSNITFNTLNQVSGVVGPVIFNVFGTGQTGISSTTPWGKLSIHGQTGDASAQLLQPLFAIGSSTPTATTTLFVVLRNGNIGIGTTTPYNPLSVFGTTTSSVFEATSTTATSTIAGGLKITGGNLQISTLTNCDTVDTDGSGNFKCGVDASGGGGAYPFPLTGNATSTLTQFNGGLTSYSSSTISALTVTDGTTTNATSTNLMVSSLATTSQLRVSGLAKLDNRLEIGKTGASNIRLDLKEDSVFTQGIRVESDLATRLGFSTFVTGDGQVRFTFRPDGLLGWGDGTSVTDTNLFRNGINILKTDSAFQAANLLTIGSSTLQNFTGLKSTTTDATTTNTFSTTASTTNFFGAGLTSNCNGSGFKVTYTTGGQFLCEADATGAGGSFPFITSTYGAQTVNSTSTGIWLTGSPFSLLASTTFTTNASSTQLTNSGSFWLPSLTSGILLTDGAGLVAKYAGTTCTNQFVRVLSALGAATCATVGAADVSLANLTATDNTLTFSGTYNGSTARTIGLNLGNANSWTGLQQFLAQASTTMFSSFGNVYIGSTATSTLQGTTAGTSTLQGFLNVSGTNSTSTFSGGLAATNLNLTGAAATNTFANGIALAAGCVTVNGSCIGGGGGATTFVTSQQITCNSPKATSTDFFIGGSSFQPAVFTVNSSDVFTIGAWNFANATSSEVDCFVRVPSNIGASPAATLTLIYTSATSTSKVAVMDIDATTTIPFGTAYNPTKFVNLISSTTAGTRISTPSAVGIGTTSAISLSGLTLNADTTIMIRIRRFGKDASDTQGDLYLMPDSYVKWTLNNQ